MSIALLKILKQNKRYNSPLAFLPTGRDIKLLVGAIYESRVSEELIQIEKKPGYNSKLHLPLSGKDVRKLVDNIACPSDNLKYIKKQLRYDTDHEYILTGKHVKILVENIEDTSCLVQPVYNVYSIQLQVYETAGGQGDWGSYGTFSASGDLGSYAGQAQTLRTFFSTADAGVNMVISGLTGMFAPHTLLLFASLPEEPVGWTWNGDFANAVPASNPEILTWSLVGVAERKCYDSGVIFLSGPGSSSDPATWTLSSGSGLVDANPEDYMSYADPGFPAKFQEYVTAWHGADAIGTFTLDPGVSIRFQITNTVNPPGFQSFDFINYISHTFTEVPC